jgi:hypothetical protein
MSDQKLGLPIRTEEDADARVQIKIVDATNTAQQAEVDANSDLHTRSKIVDEDGASFSETNPLPVSFSDSEGDEINDFDTAATIAADATSNHDYTVSGGKTFRLEQVECSASSRSKFELQVETAAASGIFNTKAVMFSSSANPNMSLKLKRSITVATGVIVRVIRTNRDNQAQDLYSTISGVEI